MSLWTRMANVFRGERVSRGIDEERDPGRGGGIVASNGCSGVLDSGQESVEGGTVGGAEV